MTWTQIDPDKFSQYEGLSPADVGRAILNRSMIHTLDILRKQQKAFEYSASLGADPWNFSVDDPSWQEFWKPVYDLKNKPMNEWNIDDFFSYRAMDYLIDLARIAASKR